MKAVLQIIFAILLAAGINGHSLLAQNGVGSPTEPAMAKITGVITFPKSMVIPVNFADAVKTHMKAYKYDLQNGTLKNPQLICGLSITFTNVTTTNTNYYSFSYVLSGALPNNKPVLISIENFSMESPAGHGDIQFIFNVSSKSPILQLSSENAVVEEYNFTTTSAFLRYNTPYTMLRFFESGQLANVKKALVY